MLRFLALALVSFAFAAASTAQTAPKRIVLDDGTVIVGEVVDPEADPVVVIGANGVEQRIPQARIAEIGPLIGGRFFRVDPTRTRLAFSPTGRTLGGGRTRVGTLFYIIPNATVGLGDRIDVSGTLPFTFGSDSFAALPVVGVKAGLVDTGSFAAAIGANAIIPLASESEVNGSFALTPYAAITVGDDLRSASVSVTGFIGGSVEAADVEAADGVLLAGGGEIQLNNGVKLLLDIGLPVGEGTEGVGFFPGVRFFGDRYSVDLFGVIAADSGGSSIDGGTQVVGFAPIANFAFTF
ncbi:MAG: hypothetical protein AAF845_12340 [Bacteroidota bacterium]